MKHIVIPSIIGVGVETTTNIIGGNDLSMGHVGSDLIVHGMLNTVCPEQIGLQGYKARFADALFHVLGKTGAHHLYDITESRTNSDVIENIHLHSDSGPLMWTAILLCVISEQIYKTNNAPILK